MKQDCVFKKSHCVVVKLLCLTAHAYNCLPEQLQGNYFWWKKINSLHRNLWPKKTMTAFIFVWCEEQLHITKPRNCNYRLRGLKNWLSQNQNSHKLHYSRKSRNRLKQPTVDTNFLKTLTCGTMSHMFADFGSTCPLIFPSISAQGNSRKQNYCIYTSVLFLLSKPGSECGLLVSCVCLFQSPTVWEVLIVSYQWICVCWYDLHTLIRGSESETLAELSF